MIFMKKIPKIVFAVAIIMMLPILAFLVKRTYSKCKEDKTDGELYI